MVVEIFRASERGKGPREMTQAVKAMLMKQIAADAIAMMRMPRRPRGPSWPGSSRPSALLGVSGADAQVKPGHDDEACRDACSLITPRSFRRADLDRSG